MNQLSSQYLSNLCLELSLLKRSGLDFGEHLVILGGKDKIAKALKARLMQSAEYKRPLSKAVEETGLFPRYFSDTIRLGEASGRLDEALLRLSDYYKRKARLSACVRSSLAYPLLLFVAMTAVVVVLITQVLPIYSELYAQMGTQLSPLSVSFLEFGIWLSSAQTVILSVLGALLLVGTLVYLVPPTRRIASRGVGKRLGDKGIFRRISETKFASAMSMGISSGFEPIEALSLAKNCCYGSYRMCKKVSKCCCYLEDGESLEHCLSKAHIFSGRDHRLLALGKLAGSTGEVMAEIAKRSEEKLADELDAKLTRLGSALLIAISVIVGLTLLSVMLPLIGILSSLS